MNFFRMAIAKLTCFFGLTGFSVAEAKTYFCTYSGTAVKRNLLPDKVEVQMKADGSATVLDPYINEEFGKPIAAKVSRAANGNPLLSWSLEIDADNRVLRVDFRLWLPAKGGPSEMTADVLRYSPRFNSKGSCEITKG